MSNIETVSLFDTLLYQTQLPEYLEDKDLWLYVMNIQTKQ